jgi:hypothetical protein
MLSPASLTQRRARSLLAQAQRKAGATLVQFTIEFFRIRASDGAHAMLARISQDVPDLKAAKVRAISLFESLDMPQSPDGLRILNSAGIEVFAWSPGGTTNPV